MENFNVLYSEHSIKSKVIFLTLNLLQIDILKNWKDCLGLEHCTTYIHTTMDHQYECSCLSVVCLLEHYESIEKMKHSLKQQCFHVSKWKQTFSNENLKNKIIRENNVKLFFWNIFSCLLRYHSSCNPRVSWSFKMKRKTNDVQN